MSDPCPHLRFDPAPEHEWPDAKAMLWPFLGGAAVALLIVLGTIIRLAID